ncbi:MAG: lamin tail domain-containing protein [Deltaproteobacteria bacterium]|nr:lamin tail domain-containing protein [Deltaproteobacteria bacterium]
MYKYLKSVFFLMFIWGIFILPSGLKATELFFSEYIEGSSYNKALEIFNPTIDSIDLALTDYSVAFYHNGTTTASLILQLTGIVSPDSTCVIANDDADKAIIDNADILCPGIIFNGDDAIVLFKDGDIIDSIGKVGEDPGSEWGDGLISTQNNTLRRLSSITTGDSDPYDFYDPIIEWEGFSSDTFDGIGSHQISDPIPEPATILLLGTGLITLAGLKRRIRG